MKIIQDSERRGGQLGGEGCQNGSQRPSQPLSLNGHRPQPLSKPFVMHINFQKSEISNFQNFVF